MNERSDRIEVGAYRAPARFGLSSLDRIEFSKDEKGKTIFVDVSSRPEVDPILKHIAENERTELQRVMRESADPAIRELAARGDKLLYVQSLLRSNDLQMLSSLARDSSDPTLSEFARAGLTVREMYVTSGRHGLWRAAENPSLDPLLRETAKLAFGRPLNLWLQTQHFGRGFGTFTVGIMGAQALNAAAFGEWEQFLKHSQEMAGWRSLRDYAAFVVGSAGGQRLYQLGHRKLPRWGLAHHFSERTVPLALGLALMDAVRREFDPFLMAFSLVTLEIGSWMTQLQLAALRLAPRIPPVSKALASILRSVKSVPMPVTRFAAESGHLALTLFNAALLTRSVVAGLEGSQEIVEEDEIHEKLAAAIKGWEKDVSAPSTQKISAAFAGYREHLIHKQSRSDKAAHKRFLDAVCAVDLERTVAYDDLVRIENPEERAWLIDRLVRPVHNDRRKSYDLQIKLYYDITPFAKDEASKKFLQGEIQRLGEESLAEEETLLGKRTTGGMIQKFRDIPR